MDLFQNKLSALQTKNRLRSLSMARGLDLSSNDYLGLTDHQTIKAAAIEAIKNGVGLGAGGSRLLRGNAPEHMALEEFAAQHYGFEKALYFANGFAANYALLTTLPSRHDVVLFDSLVHASMRDALYTPNIKSEKIAHNDVSAFEAALKKHRPDSQKIFIAVEALYSMDGDFAPLKELYALALEYDAVLIVDEAHSSGVFGAHGKGLADSLPRENLIILHTCGKALGIAGGIVCASADIIDYLINAARPFIYSTAPPPLQAYLTQKAIELSASSEGDLAREKLMALCKIAHSKLGGFGSHILPVILGDDKKAMDAAEALQELGYDIRAVRPPTVPENTARLRLSLNAKLTQAELGNIIKAVLPFAEKEKTAA